MSSNCIELCQLIHHLPRFSPPINYFLLIFSPIISSTYHKSSSIHQFEIQYTTSSSVSRSFSQKLFMVHYFLLSSPQLQQFDLTCFMLCEQRKKAQRSKIESTINGEGKGSDEFFLRFSRIRSSWFILRFSQTGFFLSWLQFPLYPFEI